MIETLLLIVIIILLAYFCWTKYYPSETLIGSRSRLGSTGANSTGAARVSSASSRLTENLEGGNETTGEADPTADMSSSFNGSEMDYKTWVANQAIDPQVIKNHKEFVTDRLKSKENITGRAYTPDSHQAEQVNWIGIRGRPQAIPYRGNPDQEPDIDKSWFPTTQKLKWS